jgi:hypothetical protein
MTDPEILIAVDPAPSTPPVFTVGVKKAANEEAAAVACLKAVVEGLAGPGSYKEGSVKTLSTADGKTADGTASKEFEMQGDLMGFPVKLFTAVAKKGDAYICVAVTTVDIMAPYNKAQFAEVCRSLFIKK